jgi:two-component system response regulator YesN
LERNGFDEVIKEIHGYFINIDYTNKINREFLDNFHRDFYYLLFGFARKRNVSLDELFANDESTNLSKIGIGSLNGLLQWVDYALIKLRDFDAGVDPVEKTKRYIIDHISDELSMGELAKNVHLNADYLTRIFKKQMGYSINRYIIESRMKAAIWMLENTSLSIGDVAAQVGYYNYSSFNRIFSKVMNMSPSEYKNSIK